MSNRWRLQLLREVIVVLGKRARQESNIPKLKPELQLEQNQRQYNRLA
jgi:hypothetical protein